MQNKSKKLEAKDELQAKYDALVDAAEDKWDELKDAFAESTESFKEGFSKIFSVFKRTMTIFLKNQKIIKRDFRPFLFFISLILYFIFE